MFCKYCNQHLILKFKEGRSRGQISPNFGQLFRKNERFSQEESMRSRQKAVPLGKISHFFTFFWPFPEFQDPGIPEFQIPDSWILEFLNSWILELPKWTVLKAEVEHRVGLQNGPFVEFQYTYTYMYTYTYTVLKEEVEHRLRFQNCPFGEFQNSGFRNSGFLNSWILDFLNSWTPQMDRFEGRSGTQITPSKWPIWGVPEFRNSGIDSWILEFLNSPNGPFWRQKWHTE